MYLFSSSTVDFEVRWTMIQLADMLVKPNEETIPKLMIHLPTPVTEYPPALPTPKLKLFTSGTGKWGEST